jgi:hypothetical protein
MTADDQLQVIIERFAHWMAQLRALAATPIILIGVSHDDHRLHAFVPHRDAPETALMVRALRQAADDLEALGPEDPERT